MTQPLDEHLGRRVRALRRSRRISQEAMAEHLGVSTQQVQKYETAANRISAASLFAIARLLAVPICCFFEGHEVQLRGDQGEVTCSDALASLPLTIVS